MYMRGYLTITANTISNSRAHTNLKLHNGLNRDNYFEYCKQILSCIVKGRFRRSMYGYYSGAHSFKTCETISIMYVPTLGHFAD